MTQHRYVTNRKGESVEVLMGWDRPLQGFFMLIERLGISDENPDIYLYNNLDQELPHPKELKPFLNALDELDIELPAGMVAAIEADKADNRGNAFTDWNDPLQ